MHTIAVQVVGFVGPAGRLGGVVGGRGVSSSPSPAVLRQEVSQGKGLPLLIPLLFSCYRDTHRTKKAIITIIWTMGHRRWRCFYTVVLLYKSMTENRCYDMCFKVKN